MRRRSKFAGVASFLILLGLGVGAAVPLARGGEGSQPTLVFVTKSDACECERNLCMVGEQEVVNFLSSNPWRFRLERVDLAETPSAAKEFGILAVPVVFLVDGQGRRVARFDGFFSWKDFQRAWEAHLAGGE
jgi:thioredoxin-like negative regulator of GroEL